MKYNRLKKGTATCAFGIPGRINHDSSKFYSSNLYKDLPKEKKVKYQELEINKDYLNSIFQQSSETMAHLPNNSVHLIVTSPPYNVGKEYDGNLTLKEYRSFLKKVWKECLRVLVPGGRACINIANLGRRPYIPLVNYIVEDMLELGFLMRGEVIWNKASSASPSTAWGTWLSAKNPILRDIHEYILIFSKDTFTRENPKKLKSTISKDQFLEYTKSIWTFPAESAKKIGHPAPFPIELPYRCIQLYTFETEIVLDPFMGSGQTAIASLMLNRYFVGYEINPRYISLAQRRIKQFINSQKTLPFE